MREIKFRVWDTEKNNFVEWNTYSTLAIHFDGIIYDGKMDFRQNKDRYVVQQYTGLKDRRGKEIYEGDIVKVKRSFVRPIIKKQVIDYEFTEGDEEIGKIYYGSNAAFLISYEHLRYDDVEEIKIASHRIEILGNIFENQELLK